MASFSPPFNGDMVSRWGGKSAGGSEFPKFARPLPVAAVQPEVGNAAELAKMVESEIIPRLMLAHSSGSPLAFPTPEAPTLNEETTEAFARMVISREPDSLMAYVGGLLKSGLTVEKIYIDLLIPAARRLGSYWDDDEASFTDVTIGLGRLQQVVRALGCRKSGAPGAEVVHSEPSERSALFAPGSGEKHTFGLFLVEDTFRRAGWRTWMEMTMADEDVVDTVRCHWFDIFGMSMNAATHVEKLRVTIKSVRAASRNPDLFIIVGGRLFADSPEYVSIVGADATAINGADAFQVADKAVRRFALK